MISRFCATWRRDAVRDALFDHALREYPRECCGLIHESGKIRRCENAIDEWRRSEPAAFDRSSRDGYALGFADLQYLIDSLAGPDPVRAVYHSHPDGSTGFSATDRAMAAPDGEPAYRQLCYLVIGCQDRRVTGADRKSVV